MSEERFDAIVVGGGLAGLTAAKVLADEGMEVLLVERGNYCGAKNMTGGRLYTHSIEEVFPGFSNEAPVERKITVDRFSKRGADGNMVTAQYRSDELAAPNGNSYSVLRSKTDRYLQDQAEESGVMMVCGVKVDKLMIDDGKVIGIEAGEEQMEANVVILADGVNSLLAQQAGLKEKLSPSLISVGAKEVLSIPSATIEERFGVDADGGLAWMFHGCCTQDGLCDGFIYTNKDSVSVGVTIMLDEIEKSDISVPQMLEDFKVLPEVAPLIEGGKLSEYSAHMIAEGSYDHIEKLYGDGLLIVGDAAGLSANLGYTLRGMDLAVESAKLAAQTVINASSKSDFSADSLSEYMSALEDSFVMCSLKGERSVRETLFGAETVEGFAGQINDAIKANGIQN